MKYETITQAVVAAGITFNDVKKVVMIYTGETNHDAGILFSLKDGRYLYSQVCNYSVSPYISNSIFYTSRPSEHDIVLDTLKQGGSRRSWQQSGKDIQDVREFIYNLKRPPSPTIFKPASPEPIRHEKTSFYHRSYEAN